jgi:hypothetical protein
VAFVQHAVAETQRGKMLDIIPHNIIRGDDDVCAAKFLAEPSALHGIADVFQWDKTRAELENLVVPVAAM